ncbi:MAG: protein translocase subunit SecF [Clostridiales bacterium]|nr:protein translocase subunit SecF [Clostridiales bacterium]
MKREFNFDIVGKKKIFFTISSVLILIAVLVSIIFGVKVDIKFQGGSMITYSYTGDIDLGKAESFIKTAIGKENSIQGSTDIATGTQSMIISMTGKTGLTVDEQQKLTQELTKEYKDHNIELVSTTNVGASIGQEFFKKCWVAVIFSALLMIIYIGFRFKKISGWSAGVMAVVALLHDVAMVYATFVIFRIPLNDNFMAVVLTILGYSVNDTIVIYDRIRENKKIYGKTLSVAELLNKSTNECMGRTINTSVTTIMAMLIVLIVSLLFGINSIVTFAFPMIIGMISGVYSTICIAGPLWVVWQEHKEKKANAKKFAKAKA